MRARTRSVLGALVALASAAALAACSSDTPAGHAQPLLVTVPARSASAAEAKTTAHGAPAPATSTAVTAKPTPRPKPNHCARNTYAQKVIVSIAAQRMWLCAGTRTVESNAVTTGMVGHYTATPTGDYTIQGRTTDTTLTLNSGQAYAVHYWIPFDAPLFGFHDSSWQTFPYGSSRYRTNGSHGCVHMPLRAIAFLYAWSANTTTAVHIA